MDYYYDPQQANSEGASWLSGSNFLTRVMGFSFFASMLQSNSYMVDSVRLFLLGTIIESGRRFCQWLIERFWFRQYTASFLIKLPLLTGLVFGRILHNRTIHWRRSCLWVDHSFSCMPFIHPLSKGICQCLPFNRRLKKMSGSDLATSVWRQHLR